MNGTSGQTALERQLQEHEGWKPYAYKDSLGYLTIGFGRMVDSRLGGGITPEEGLYLLRNDIAKHEHELRTALPWVDGLDEVRMRVLIDMCFNLGIGKLLKFTGTLAAIKRRDWDAAATGMRDSLWARQVGDRAERLARMMELGRPVAKWW